VPSAERSKGRITQATSGFDESSVTTGTARLLVETFDVNSVTQDSILSGSGFINIHDVVRAML
jgi:hypothetical protein